MKDGWDVLSAHWARAEGSVGCLAVPTQDEKALLHPAPGKTGLDASKAFR